jgi:signal transduction histidine kinase
MVAVLALVAGTLLVASLGSFLLIRRASATTAEQELYTQARYIAAGGAGESHLNDRLLTLVKHLGDYRSLSIAGLSADGTFTSGLPAVLDGQHLRPADLNADLSVAGSTGDVVYVLIPLNLSAAQKTDLRDPIAADDAAVLVATRAVHSPVSGKGWFFVVGLASLAVAAVVAYLLANRFSRPLVVAAKATQRIAEGAFDTRIPVAPHDLAEFAALAGSINAMADGLARARDQQRHLLLSVSHDLRTPLTSIAGYAEALGDGTATDVEAASAVIGAEARRLERLVQDLLDLARLDARRFSLERARVDVADVVRRSAERFSPEAAGATVSLTADAPGDALWALADGDRLAQILANLVENALKFARSSIVLGARAERDQVVVWVDDDGPGISAEDLPHVFEPHFTSDRAAGRARGTGLGLAIVAELAAAMGGGSRADSPIGTSGGTRMVVWLPLAPAAPAVPWT